MEDKRLICGLLTPALQATRQYKDLVDLEYHDNKFTDDAYVLAVFSCGSKIRIDVTADSGSAMIRDIMRAIE